MKKRFKILSRINPQESTLCASEEGSSAAFLADPMCTALPYINANRFGFTREGLLLRANTMSMKPLNFMHEKTNIVGHINASGHGIDSAGRTSAFASGVMYRRIFPDLVDQMVAKNGFDLFKVSIEASFDDISWILHDTLVNSEVVGDYSVKALGEDPELDDMGMLCLWMFGTLAGFTHGGKDVSAIIGGKDNSFEFVGLAITDELAGKAADQNCKISVFASETCPKIHSISEDSVTDIVLAVAMRDEATLSEFGISLEQRDELVSKFVEDHEGMINCSSIILNNQYSSSEEEIVQSADEVVVDGEVLSTDGEDMIPLSSAMRAQDKITRKYLRKISSLERKISGSEAEIANLKEALRVKAIEVESAVVSEKDSNSALKAKLSDFEKEIIRLRKFELACLGLSSVAKEFEEEISSMPSESFSEFKKKYSAAGENRPIVVNFEEQTKRVLSKK